MNAQEQLLVRRWILRSQDPQLYYEIKDHQKELRRRFQDKFGYALIINPLLAKLEKIPGQAQASMGIQAFESIREYQMFCYLLMFLEDKEIEEQFILSTLTEYVALCFPKGEVSWNSYQCRRQLIHVLQYAVKSGLIKVTDGDGEGFLRNEQQEVLYENSGISRYFVRNFMQDIMHFQEPEEFSRSEWFAMEEDRGIVRRQRIYRKLLLSCGVYPDTQKEKDEDFAYIRNYRGHIARDLEQLFPCELQVYSSAAFLVLDREHTIGNVFPQNHALHDLILLVHAALRKRVQANTLTLSANEVIEMEIDACERMVQKVIRANRSMLPKKYQEESISAKKLCEQLLSLMESYGFMEQREHTCLFFPVVAKRSAAYREEEA